MTAICIVGLLYMPVRLFFEALPDAMRPLVGWGCVIGMLVIGSKVDDLTRRWRQFSTPRKDAMLLWRCLTDHIDQWVIVAIGVTTAVLILAYMPEANRSSLLLALGTFLAVLAAILNGSGWLPRTERASDRDVRVCQAAGFLHLKPNSETLGTLGA